MSAPSTPSVLFVDYVDPTAASGLLADIETAVTLGVHACGVVSAIAARGARHVLALHAPPAAFVAQQISALRGETTLAALKLGFLGSAATIHAVAEAVRTLDVPHCVLDPVMHLDDAQATVSKEALAALRETLLPLATILTPNLLEAGLLLEQRPPDTLKELYRTAERLRERMNHSGQRWVLVKAGHIGGSDALDLLTDGDRMLELASPRLDTPATRGMGDRLSAAIAVLAPQHTSVPDAVRQAKEYVTKALAHAAKARV